MFWGSYGVEGSWFLNAICSVYLDLKYSYSLFILAAFFQLTYYTSGLVTTSYFLGSSTFCGTFLFPFKSPFFFGFYFLCNGNKLEIVGTGSYTASLFISSSRNFLTQSYPFLTLCLSLCLLALTISAFTQDDLLFYCFQNFLIICCWLSSGYRIFGFSWGQSMF